MTSPAYDTPETLRIVTLNCWGLKYIAKYRNERLTEIGNQLARSDPAPDIVGLQECWTQQDYLAIREKTRHILPYGKFYYSGIFGGGLAILSRWPIEESSMYRYPSMDGHQLSSAAIVTPPQLHAPYEREPNDSYLCHRTAQAWEMAKLLRHAAERGHLVISLGDFNMVPLSLAHRIIETHSPVRDVWRLLRPNSSLGAASQPAERRRGRKVPTAEDNLEVNGATCDSCLNTWRWSKPLRKRLNRGEDVVVELDTEDPKAKRLDYIFFSCGEKSPRAAGDVDSDGGREDDAAGPEWTVESANVGMTGRHPTLKCSLSDHFSVEATLWRRNHQLQPTVSTATDASAFPRADTAHSARLPVAVYDEILELIRTYNLREVRQRKVRLAHFVAQVALAVGCLVGVWWAPRNYVAFLLMLWSTLGLSAGVIDGLIGGLFVGSELRALWEFEWEVRTAREAALLLEEKKKLEG
ncbi:phospholipase C type enzyme [Coniosporium tulheliwenetii]|uniref:Phospholipase C type enzyme n=1 Tax=Coniosporium tulheliwenetii TaxID=3383036 RepID=A0ACC2ZNB9_9PEZI|nr:phospholipase C type enzyme [Cladosporium sp. JES 115]